MLEDEWKNTRHWNDPASTAASTVSPTLRDAIRNSVTQAREESTVLANLIQHSAQVKELEQRLELLTVEFATLKAGMHPPLPEDSTAGEARTQRPRKRKPTKKQSEQESRGSTGDRRPRFSKAPFPGPGRPDIRSDVSWNNSEINWDHADIERLDSRDSEHVSAKRRAFRKQAALTARFKEHTILTH